MAHFRVDCFLKLEEEAFAHDVDSHPLHSDPQEHLRILFVIDPLLLEISLDFPSIQDIGADIVFEGLLVLGYLIVVVTATDLADGLPV